MVKKITLTVIILLATAITAEAVGVRAVVDRNQATVGESIVLQLTIEGADGEIDLSGVTEFKALSRGSTNSIRMINGRTSRQMIHNYVLIPLKSGDLTIPAIPVTIDAKVYHTAPIQISVSQEPTVASGQRDVYVTAAVAEASPWVGQQTIYTFRLFNAVQVADAKFQPPEFVGFNAEEIEDRKSYRRVVNGRELMVTEVVFILVPLKPGPLTIQPAVLQVGLLRRSRRPRPFAGMDAFFGRSEMTTRILETDPITLTVRALPPQPTGSAFSGLVGTFELDASLEKTNVAVGDSTTLAVTVSGTGNIMDAAAPTIPTPGEFKTYADNPEEVITKDAQGYAGRKTFRTALVPVKAGNYRVDPIQLTIFDVDTGRYRSLATPAVEISVDPSSTVVTDIDVVRAAPDQVRSLKKRVEFTGRDILPLKDGLEALAIRRGMSPYWFGLLLVLPILGFTITRTVLGMMRKDESPRRIMAERARLALKAAGADPVADADFLSALYRALVAAILSAKGVMGTSLTWSEAKAQLIGIGWEADAAETTARLLEEVESFNYSGGSLDRGKRSDLLARSRQAVGRLI